MRTGIGGRDEEELAGCDVVEDEVTVVVSRLELVATERVLVLVQLDASARGGSAAGRRDVSRDDRPGDAPWSRSRFAQTKWPGGNHRFQT